MNEEEIEKKVEERLNIRELKMIRKQLEAMNRENTNEHKRLSYNVESLAILQKKHEQSIQKLQDQNWWSMMVDWIAILIKKKESYVFPAILSILAFWQQIYEFIQHLIP